MTVLILFQSIEGQTRRIAERAQALVEAAGLRSTMINLADRLVPVSFENVDSVILAAPVHERRHPENFEALVAASRHDLMARRNLLLSVSLSAAFPEGRSEAHDYVVEMTMRTRFSPDRTMLVAGGVQGGGYDYFEQQVLRHNVLRTRRIELDRTGRDFTDWEALDREITAFAARSPAEA